MPTSGFPWKPLALVFLLVVGAGAWFFQSQMALRRDEAYVNLLAVSRLKQSQIVQWCQERLADARVVQANAWLAGRVKHWLDTADPTAEAEIRGYFQALQEQYRYANVMVVDPSGKVRLTIASHPGTIHVEAVSALERAMAQALPQTVDLHRHGSEPSPHIDFIAPVLLSVGGKPQTIGAVFLQCEATDYLYPLIQSWPAPSGTAETLLVKRAGDSVLFLNEIRHRQDTALKLRLPLSNLDVPGVQAALGTTGAFEGRDYRGVPVLSVLTPIPDTPWVMVTKIDADEAFAPMRREMLLLGALYGTISLGIIGFLASWWQRQRSSYLQSLLEQAGARQRAEERFRVTLASVGDGVISADTEGRVEFLNPVAERLTGWPLEDARGKALAEVFRIFSEETRQPVESPVEVVLRKGMTVGLANHTILIARDGSERPIADSGAPIRGEDGRMTGVVLVFRDGTEERRYRHERDGTIDLLKMFNRVPDFRAFLREVTGFLHQWSGFEAVGIRLRQGDDFPYFETRGFRPEFVAAESHLCERDLQGQVKRDTLGKPILECMCGNVLCARFNPDLPFFTSRGSFWSNHTTELLATTSEADRQARTRNRCNGEGYESVGLFPLKVGQTIIGLLQLNDRRIGRFTPDLLLYLENAADQIAIAIDQRRSREELSESEEKFRHIVEALRSEYFFYRHGPDGVVTYVSPSVTSILGYPLEEIQGHFSRFLTPHPKNAEAARHTGLAFQGIQQPVYEIEVFHRNGEVRQLEISETPVIDAQGRVVAIEGIARDMTSHHQLEAEKGRLQEQLMQAQKMEAIGRLAGGIAHDFNNMLGVIQGHAELLLDTLEPGHPHFSDLQAIMTAARRSADLTRQLLGFARKQPINPRKLDLNEIVASLLKMLRRLIGEQLELSWKPWREPCLVFIDPTQIDQVLVNLTSNARDAIDGTGRITVETRRVQFDQAFVEENEDFEAGDFVQLSVSDTGRGMAPETRARLFEPFFTTKGLGKGTGLGLATVYGIMRQNRGFIRVYSEPGAGSTFHLFFPAAAGLPDRTEDSPAPATLMSRGETVLVVEDEPGLLAMIQGMLERLGYRVLAAAATAAAITTASTQSGPIHLLLSDVILPEMNGRSMAETCITRFPGLKVLFMSGYSEDVIAYHGVLTPDVSFIQKPFTMDQLAQAVRGVLDRSGPPEPGPGPRRR